MSGNGSQRCEEAAMQVQAETRYTESAPLVDTEWVAARLDEPGVRLVEVDVDTRAYDEGHIPGAIGWNWTTQLCDTVRRDIVSRPQFEALMSASGIDAETTVVLYGDNNNWFAAWALWQLEMYGHREVRIMNGGRKKWLDESRPLTRIISEVPRTRYQAGAPDAALRVFLPGVLEAVAAGAALVDVRSPQEYSGEILAPPGLPEGCQRGGHIPGAVNVPWSKACNEDGTFRSAEELEALYRGAGVTPERPVITYCRIGERSSHTWFVLRHLLGYPDVRNYDGSWTEWGNLVGAAIERPFRPL
jgi:thiosulfate/3-mercaptopyruvate sulfurtransferase